jgi:hypothetical protein
MTFQIRVMAIADDGQEQVHGITSLQRTELKMETLGQLWRKAEPPSARSNVR